MRTHRNVLEALRRSPLVGTDLELERECSNGRRFNVRMNEPDVRGSPGEVIAKDHQAPVRLSSCSEKPVEHNATSTARPET
jgi:hypothetical protein